MDGKSADNFRSPTPLYRRYPLWPPPQLTPSAACCSFGGKQAPLSRTDTENRTWPRKRGCSPGSLLSCTAQGSLPSQAPVSRTNSRSRMWPGKRGCSPGSFLARAALPRSPLTTAPNAQCTNLSYAQCSAMLSTQACLHPRSFSTKVGRTRYRPDDAQLGQIQHGHSSGQPAQSRQSDADIVPQAPQPPGWGASEPAFSARDAQFFGNCHRTWWEVRSEYRDHSLSPFTEAG